MSQSIDPIMQEVYEAKEQIARDAGFDIGELAKRLRAAEQDHPERLVYPSSRQAEIVRKALHPTSAA